DELDPHAEALLRAVGAAGHRLVLTAHAGTTDVAGLADEVADPGEPLLATVRRVQAQGHGVLLVASGEGSLDLPGRGGAGAWAAVSALRLDARPAPVATVHTPWHALDPDQVLRRVAQIDREEREPDRPAAGGGSGAGSAGVLKATFRTRDALNVAFTTLRTS